MPLNEAGPEGEMSMDEIAEAAAAWLEESGVSPAEKVRIAKILTGFPTIEELTLGASQALAEAGIDLDITELLRAVGAVEDEGPSILIHQEATDADPANVEEQKRRRAVLLAPYTRVYRGDLSHLLGTDFMAECSEERNLYIAVRWCLAEQLQEAIERDLFAGERTATGKEPTKKRQRELKREAESRALVEATRHLAAAGIHEPSA